MKNRTSPEFAKLLCSLILASSALLSAVSCGESAIEEETKPQPTVPSAEAETEPEETEYKYVNEVPVSDLNGMTIGLASDSLSSTYFNILDVEETIGETFNDAIYDRNRRIEDKYNMKFLNNATGGKSLLEASVVSGSRDVDLAYYLVSSVMTQVMKGYLLPFNELEYVNMSNPYWDQIAIKTLSVKGKMYHGYVDFGFDHYDSMAVLFYNGAIITDFNLEDPYQLYLEEKWSMDKMKEMMTAVSQDINGDGKIVLGRDRIGFTGREFNFLPTLYSSNADLMTIVEDGDSVEFVYNLGSENVIKVGEITSKLFNDESISLPDGGDSSREAFMKGNALFYSRLLGDFRLLREQEDDYGLIGYPSVDGSNEGCRVYVQCPTTLVVAADTNPETTGLILEAVAADTYDEVLPIYIEKSVIGKGLRDANSAEMLRTMITHRAYDVAYSYGMESTAVNAYSSSVLKNNFASTFKRYESKIRKETEKYIDKLTD